MYEIPTGEPAGYAEFLAELKQRIERAQLRASLAVNRELILLYWKIGREILSRQDRESWGGKVIDRLAADLKGSFPEMRRGFSPRNLKYMRAFAEAWGGGGICARSACTNHLVSQHRPHRETQNSGGPCLVCARYDPARLEPKRSCSPNRIGPPSTPGQGSDRL